MALFKKLGLLTVLLACHSLALSQTQEDPTQPIGTALRASEFDKAVELISRAVDLTPKLDAGSYVFICNIVEDEGDDTIVHYQQGMRVGFTAE